MSTRSNHVILADPTNQWEKDIWLYRHSDGYPEGVARTQKMLAEVGRSVGPGGFRSFGSNVDAADWMIVLGAIEYHGGTGDDSYRGLKGVELQRGPNRWGEGSSTAYLEAKLKLLPGDRHVGAYEHTDACHGDIEYLYVFNVKRCQWHAFTAHPFDDGWIKDEVPKLLDKARNYEGPLERLFVVHFPVGDDEDSEHSPDLGWPEELVTLLDDRRNPQED